MEIKISQITRLALPKKDFVFLGTDMTDSGNPINNTIDYNTISNNIHNNAVLSAYELAHEDAVKLSNVLTGIIDSKYNYLTSNINKTLTSVYNIDEYAKKLCIEISCLSNGLSNDIILSIDNINGYLTADLIQQQRISTELLIHCDEMINKVSTHVATIESVGNIKLYDGTKAADEKYHYYGLSVDETARGFIKIPNTDLSGNGSGSGGTPSDYDTVRTNAKSGADAIVLLTSDDLIPKELSAKYDWAYTSLSTDSEEKSISVNLKSVKNELANIHNKTYNIEHDLDQALSVFNSLSSLSNAVDLLEKVPLHASPANRFVVSSDISTIIGTYNVIIDATAEEISDYINYLTTKYGASNAGTIVSFTNHNDLYIKYVTQVINNVPVYSWYKITDEIKSHWMFYTKLESDDKFLTEHLSLDDYAKKSEILKLESVYPVNSVYITTSNINPLTTFGFGKWLKITSDDTTLQWTTKTLYAFERTE